jgi:serpin B
MNRLFAIILVLFLLPNAFMAQEKNITKAVEGNNEFCFDWMKTSYKQGENQVYSPFSISAALAMTFDGAKWRTKREIAETMHFQHKISDNHEAWTNLINYFDQLESPIFQTANAVWIQKNFNFLDGYINGIKDYNAKIKTVDFKDTNSREDARKNINQWVESKTENKIRQLIRKSDVDKLTRLVLVNAIYYKAEWKYEFSEKLTRTDEFTNRKSKFKCDFMHMETEFSTYHSEEFSVIEIPYRSDLSSMIIILPNEDSNMESVLDQLNNKSLDNILQNMKPEKIQLSIPKFSISSRLEMKNLLTSMGMIIPFSPNSNFSGMNGKRNLVIDQIIHQAVIELNEKGTEASAATAVVVREKSAKITPSFNADHPFIFLIRENKQGSILFAGVLENPEKQER